MRKLKGIKHFMENYILTHDHVFRGKIVVDLPAGSGVTSGVLKRAGASVLPFDLFPEFFQCEGLHCTRVNILEKIPLVDNQADVVICQEGIEHFSDQLKVLREFNRILKNGGLLIVTTPNHSNLRSKVSYLLSESERFGSLMPPNELDSIWMSDQQLSKEIYFGHIFLIGIQKLRLLAKLSGFKIKNILFERARPTSVLLFPFFYPFIFLANWMAYRKNMRKNDGLSREIKQRVYGEVFRLSITPKILIDGTLFVELEKESEVSAVAQNLRGIYKDFTIVT
jgi:SAM-dependent methyltransferase